MWSLFKRVIVAIIYSRAYSALFQGTLAKINLKRLLMGIILFLIGGQLLLMGLFILALSIFFHLADLGQYVFPSLWTGLIVLLISIFLFMQGGALWRAKNN